MKRFTFLILVLVAIFYTLPLQSQPWTSTHVWTATHAEDARSNYFPLGFYAFYLDREIPPFGLHPVSRDYPTEQQMIDWIEADWDNINALHANYFVEFIPSVYNRKRDNPPPWEDQVPFENDLFRDFANSVGFSMDYKDTAPWVTGSENPNSIRSIFLDCPEALPPELPDPPDPVLEQAWLDWYDRVDSTLIAVRNVVISTDPTNPSPYSTFYVAHESDIYPDANAAAPISITDLGRARRHALQYICHEWDVLDAVSPTNIKPFAVFGAITRYETDPNDSTHQPVVLPDIASTCRNLRMAALDCYPIDPYISTTYATPHPSTGYRFGQREAFQFLIDELERYESTFNNAFDREVAGLPIELWFVGQAAKSYHVDASGNALADGSWWTDPALYPTERNGSSKRYPTYEELKLQAYLALSRGFKGIIWYTYGSHALNYDSTGNPVQQAEFGVVRGKTIHDNPSDSDRIRITSDLDIDINMVPQHPWTASNCSSLDSTKVINPFHNVERVNDTIRQIGPFFRTLDYVDSFDQNTIPDPEDPQSINDVGLISCTLSDDVVTAYNTFNNEALDFSLFHGPGTSVEAQTRYLMVVNKVLNSTTDLCEVDPKKELVFSFNENTVLVRQPMGTVLRGQWEGNPAEFVVRDSIWPGEGRIYRVKSGCPYYVDGTEIIDDVFNVHQGCPIIITNTGHLVVSPTGWVRLYDNAFVHCELDGRITLDQGAIAGSFNDIDYTGNFINLMGPDCLSDYDQTVFNGEIHGLTINAANGITLPAGSSLLHGHGITYNFGLDIFRDGTGAVIPDIYANEFKDLLLSGCEFGRCGVPQEYNIAGTLTYKPSNNINTFNDCDELTINVQDGGRLECWWNVTLTNLPNIVGFESSVIETHLPLEPHLNIWEFRTNKGLLTNSELIARKTIFRTNLDPVTEWEGIKIYGPSASIYMDSCAVIQYTSTIPSIAVHIFNTQNYNMFLEPRFDQNIIVNSIFATDPRYEMTKGVVVESVADFENRSTLHFKCNEVLDFGDGVVNIMSDLLANGNRIHGCGIGLRCEYYGSTRAFRNTIENNKYGIYADSDVGYSYTDLTVEIDTNRIVHNITAQIYLNDAGCSSQFTNTILSNGQPVVPRLELVNANVDMIDLHDQWWGYSWPTGGSLGLPRPTGYFVFSESDYQNDSENFWLDIEPPATGEHPEIGACPYCDSQCELEAYWDGVFNESGGGDPKAGKVVRKSLSAPISNVLIRNYPNPFNPSTVIEYTLPQEMQIVLKVYNASGAEVGTLVEGRKEAGTHTAEFNGKGLPSGLYIYELQTPNGTIQGNMMMTK